VVLVQQCREEGDMDVRSKDRREHGRQGFVSSLKGWLLGAVVLLLCGPVAAGCSVRKMAVDRAGDALSRGGSSFSSDDDPDLVKAAAPFSLKLMESLLDERPGHRGLRLAAASGFTQYSFAFVQQDADELQDADPETAARLRARARLLYLRGRNHALRGLNAALPGFEDALREKPRETLGTVRREETPLLYWAAVSWAAAISLSKNDPDLIADLPYVEALIDRAMELDEGFDAGAIHTFLISYEPARKGGSTDAAARSKRHFDRALELTGGEQAGPFVSLAEAVSIGSQDRGEFVSLLSRALAIDSNARPERRLTNLIMQRRAKWLLSQTDRLFYSSAQVEN
jgi:predicted anti-sigma-YlaC factor YlaD